MARSLPARPRQVAPAHPGAVIADVLEGAHISLRKAASAIGMSPTGLQKVLAGNTPVTPDTALRIAAYFDNGPTGAELFLNMQRDYDLWHARARLAKALAKIVPVEKN